VGETVLRRLGGKDARRTAAPMKPAGTSFFLSLYQFVSVSASALAMVRVLVECAGVG